MDLAGSFPALRLGYVPLVRPAFRGDAVAVIDRSLEGLRELGRLHGFEAVTAHVDSDARQAHDGARLPACAVASPTDAGRAAHQLASAELDVLLVQHATFATGDELAPLLRLGVRTGLWAVPEVGPDAPANGPLPLNSLCGVLMSASLVDRPEVEARIAHRPLAWFYGHADAPAFRARLGDTIAALRGIRAMTGATVLQIGGTAPGFYGIRDLPDALGALGVRVVDRPLEDLFGAMSAASDAQLDVATARMAEGAHVDVDEGTLRRAARIEAALETLARESHADALAVRCWPEIPERCGAVACAGLGDLSGAGVPAACEGDVLGALSMLALQGLGRAPAILMDVSDVDAEREALLLWHCGNAPVAWAAGDAGATGPRLTRHFNRSDLGAVRDMQLRAGPASAFRLLDGGRASVVVTGRIETPRPASFDGVRGWFGDLRWGGMDAPGDRATRHVPGSAGAAVGAMEAVASLLAARVPHHLALVPGDWTRALGDLCAWLDAPMVPAVRHPVPTVLPARP